MKTVKEEIRQKVGIFQGKLQLRSASCFAILLLKCWEALPFLVVRKQQKERGKVACNC